MGRLPTRERLATTLLLLVVQHGFQSAFQVQLPHADRGVATDVERFADLGVGPALGGFEQDAGTGEGTCVGFARVDERV